MFACSTRKAREKKPTDYSHKDIARDESGAAFAEYGLLIGLIAAICLVLMRLIGQEISSVFDYMTSAFAGVI